VDYHLSSSAGPVDPVNYFKLIQAVFEFILRLCRSIAAFLETFLVPTPLLVEGLLFVLICFIITVISVSMDEEGSEGALSFLS
jgi:hypothetical protein